MLLYDSRFFLFSFLSLSFFLYFLFFGGGGGGGGERADRVGMVLVWLGIFALHLEEMFGFDICRT